jgi:hypothetical protein
MSQSLKDLRERQSGIEITPCLLRENGKIVQPFSFGELSMQRILHRSRLIAKRGEADGRKATGSIERSLK